MPNKSTPGLPPSAPIHHVIPIIYGSREIAAGDFQRPGNCPAHTDITAQTPICPAYAHRLFQACMHPGPPMTGMEGPLPAVLPVQNQAHPARCIIRVAAQEAFTRSTPFFQALFPFIIDKCRITASGPGTFP